MALTQTLSPPIAIIPAKAGIQCRKGLISACQRTPVFKKIAELILT